MKRKKIRRVDTKWYGSTLSSTETNVYCTNKKLWPREGEEVLYGFSLWRITKRYKDEFGYYVADFEKIRDLSQEEYGSLTWD
jgi:hypothetical protein